MTDLSSSNYVLMQTWSRTMRLEQPEMEVTTIIFQNPKGGLAHREADGGQCGGRRKFQKLLGSTRGGRSDGWMWMKRTGWLAIGRRSKEAREAKRLWRSGRQESCNCLMTISCRRFGVDKETLEPAEGTTHRRIGRPSDKLRFGVICGARVMKRSG
jgi:hypothetical protein